MPKSNSHKIWGPLPDIVVALLLGAWLPLRLVFFEHHETIDKLIEAGVLIAIVLRRLSGQRLYLTNADSRSGRILANLLDIAVALPVVTLLSFSFDAESSKWFFVFKLLYLPMVFKVRHVLDRFDSLHPILYRLLPLAFILPLVVHLIACGWVYLGSGTATPTGDRLYDYARAVHWAFTTLTTVGYGDITPVTMGQMFYANMTMVIGVGFFGYVLSNVASLLSRLDAARQEYLSNLDRVEAFIRSNELPMNMRTKIRAYYRYLWDIGRGYQDSSVLDRLPPKLRGEVALYLNAEMIERVPVLSEADLDCKEEIVLAMSSHITVPGERIFHAGDAGEAMYFIHRGVVDIVTTDGTHIASLGAGTFFGEMALLTNSPRSAAAITREFCDLYVLSRESFEQVLSRYPAFAAHVREVGEQRAEENAAQKPASAEPA